ncbi:MAG: TonB-dependent receptor [Sphingomonas sp.]|nr:TonB-dependent receptor [Sphingomonas sp.]
MRRTTTFALSTVSFGALALAAAAPASAQVEAATAQPAPGAIECEALPTQAERDQCAATETTTAPATTAASADTGTIVVTGSRIRRDEFTAAEPLTVITAEEITQAGFNSATDALQSAAVTQGSGQINNYFGGFVTDGGTGANTLGLRGLGPARTLVLLNGRRLAPGGTRGSVLAADLNVLPTAIVDRIEVLKAGASSIYGSDAVAGVVNIITDRKPSGLHIDMQANVPEVGAGADYRIAGSFGIQADRLNVIGSVEYRKRKQLSRKDVDFFDCPIGGFLTGEGTEFGSGDGVGFDGSPCFTLDNGGVTINTLGLPTRDALSRTTGAVGRFNRFIPAPGVTTGPFPGYLGVDFYSRDTFEPDMEKEPLITSAEIYTGYLSATYDLGILGNSELYGEILATRRKSSSPLYRQLSLDWVQGSPLLPENIRDGRFLGPNETSGGKNVAARGFIGFGLTDSSQKVDYVRASAGLRGDFFLPGWRYDAYVGKSWNDGTYEIESFLIDRMAASLDVVDNGDGTFSCASLAINPNCIAAPALSAEVIGGNLPADWRDWILANTIGKTEFRETTFAFGVDGPLFALPGGDVQLALSAEYRTQSINAQPDENSTSGNLLGLTAATPTVGQDSVKELYGEIFVPLLADRPMFYRLNLNGSVRYTDYKSYGSDTTFKIAGEWEPIRGVGLRGSYGTSYRAPALAEQFLGATSGFLGSGNDPCDDLPAPGDQSPTDQIVAANCASIGLPPDFQQNSSITVFRVGGAEAGLAAETSKNWSVGAVVRPALPGSLGSLSLSLDYFNIKVENGVQDLSAGTILNRCYQDPNFNPNEGFCRFVERDVNNRLTVTSSFVNLSEDIVKGYEFNARYANDLLGGRLIFNANVTKYTEQSSRLFPEEFLTDANGIVTAPDWVGNFDATYTRGKVTFRYGVDWIDGNSDATYKYFAFDNLTGEIDEAAEQFYRDNYYFKTKDYFLHSASVQFNLNDYEFTIGARNLFDKAPPRITAIGFNTIGNAPLYSGYDYRGRTFFANANFKF